MQKLTSKIFIDGGVPEETRKANEMFEKHFEYPLDGQTTNPTLIAKNLKAQGGDITPDSALDEYKNIVKEISKILPHGSVSIQVLANKDTSSEEMIAQARDRITWISNASIKIPMIEEGMKAAEVLCQEMPINITLVFSQAQAAAVYEATNAALHPVFLSPFVGRLDDLGQNGMDVIANILKLYKTGDGHVETLTASVRTQEHLMYALFLGSPIITIPFTAFAKWAEGGFVIPDASFSYSSSLTPISYDETVALGKKWNEYDLRHELTDKGLASFWSSWNELFAV